MYAPSMEKSQIIIINPLTPFYADLAATCETKRARQGFVISPDQPSGMGVADP